MKLRFAFAVLICVVVAGPTVMAQAPLIYKGRLAFSHDGNQNDRDDWGASAFEFAICWSFGVQRKVVHFDYSDFINASAGTTGDKQMIESCTGGPKHFPGFDATKIFNDLTQLSAAIANFKLQAEKGGPGDTLAYICAGPMEVPWRCLNAVSREKRQFIKVIQHGRWNMTTVSGSKMTHDWNSCLSSFPEVKFVKIADQNGNLGGASTWGFLSSMPRVCNLDPSAWVWLKSRDLASGDVSDVGMTWYTLTGSQSGTPADLEKRFKNPICNLTVLRAAAPAAPLSRPEAISPEPYYSVSGRLIDQRFVAARAGRIATSARSNHGMVLFVK